MLNLHTKLGITWLLILITILMIIPTIGVWNMEVMEGCAYALSVMAALGLCGIFAGCLWVLVGVWK